MTEALVTSKTERTEQTDGDYAGVARFGHHIDVCENYCLREPQFAPPPEQQNQSGTTGFVQLPVANHHARAHPAYRTENSRRTRTRPP